MSVFAEVSGVFLVGVDNPGVLARVWRQVTSGSAEETIWWWIDTLLPKHFDRSNWHVYRNVFFKRSRWTQKRKARKYGHTAALVNHPLHSPPSTRPTLEAMMTRALPVMRRVNGGASATWLTPGIDERYKNEAVAINDEDAEATLRQFHKAVMGRFSRGEAPLKRAVKQTMTRDTYDSLYRLVRVPVV